MSAFVVCKGHIDYMVTAGIKYGIMPPEMAGSVGAMLWAENVRSVNARYREEEWEEPYVFAESKRELSPVQVAKAVDCYEYQSCEHGDWERRRPRQASGLQRRHVGGVVKQIRVQRSTVRRPLPDTDTRTPSGRPLPY